MNTTDNDAAFTIEEQKLPLHVWVAVGIASVGYSALALAALLRVPPFSGGIESMIIAVLSFVVVVIGVGNVAMLSSHLRELNDYAHGIAFLSKRLTEQTKRFYLRDKQFRELALRTGHPDVE